MSISPEHRILIASGLSTIMGEAWRIADEKGWHAKYRSVAEIVANLHGEVSEFFNAYAHNEPPSQKIPGFSSAEEEAADILIRLVEASKDLGLRLVEATIAKMEYNETRSYRHGGKRF